VTHTKCTCGEKLLRETTVFCPRCTGPVTRQEIGRLRAELAFRERALRGYDERYQALQADRDEARKAARELFTDSWRYAANTSERLCAVMRWPWLEEETE
jgi:cyclopropane fatty-acyl-phospholipid synthase-like methyltransferase